MRIASLLGVLLFFSSSASWSAPLDLMDVSAVVWKGLSEDARINLQSKKLIQLVEADSAGVIIDAQGLDKSDPGSNAGSNLGAAVGNAAYIDRAISNQNYSAKSQLGAILLGGLIGSALNRPQTSQYQFRYSIRLLNGSIHTQDLISSEPFRKPLGICVKLPNLEPAVDQNLCSQSVESVKSLIASQLPLELTVQGTNNPTFIGSADVKHQPPIDAVSPHLINCKPHNLASIRTTSLKCIAINGEIQSD